MLTLKEYEKMCADCKWWNPLYQYRGVCELTGERVDWYEVDCDEWVGE